jgi:hypothetical protein
MSPPLAAAQLDQPAALLGGISGGRVDRSSEPQQQAASSRIPRPTVVALDPGGGTVGPIESYDPATRTFALVGEARADRGPHRKK